MNPIAFIIVGIIVWVLAYIPPMPPAWVPFVRALGGALVLIGVILILIVLLGGGTVEWRRTT